MVRKTRKLLSCLIALVMAGVICVPALANTLRDYGGNFSRDFDSLSSFGPTRFSPPPADDDYYEPEEPAPRVWHTSMLSQRPLARRLEGLDLRGDIPVVTAAFGPEYRDINDHIADTVVSSLIRGARGAGARSIIFSHDSYSTDEIVSLVIYADVSAAISRTLVRTVNFCLLDGRLVSMSEALGMDIEPLVERILAEKIRSNPEHYYAALSVTFANQAFYLTDRRLVLLFDEFRLSTRVTGVDSIELARRNIRTYSLGPGEYRHGAGYGLKMIPLRRVAEFGLGFTVRWDAQLNHAEVRLGSRLLMELVPDYNNYEVFGTQQRSLEAAPENHDGVMYVPITFFDQILPLTTYSVCRRGSVTFLAYVSS